MFSRVDWLPLTLPSQPSLSWYYSQRVEEENRNLEKKIIFRALPDFNKAVTSRSRMNITRMDEEVWKYWLFTMNSRVPFDTVTTKKVKYPDHGFWREEGNSHCSSSQNHRLNFYFLELQRVGWDSKLPVLSETEKWWEKKWSSRYSGELFRAKILNLYLVRNTWTGFLRAEFNYTTEKWSELENKWNWR